jgi:hypothetical protein
MTSRRILLILSAAVLLCQTSAHAQSPPEHAKRYNRLLIRNAIVVEGNGTPASGPRDITAILLSSFASRGGGNIGTPDAAPTHPARCSSHAPRLDSAQ